MCNSFENDGGQRYGTSMNVFGPDSITRLVDPHIPQGVALLGDFRQLMLFLRHSMRIDVATQGAPG